MGLLLVVQYFLTHSVLIVSSTDDTEKTVHIRRGEHSQDFVLKNSSKTLVLPSGSYNVEVTEGEKQTLYEKKLGRFWIHKLQPELTSQKAAVPLGENFLGCAIDLESSGEVAYYSCELNGSDNFHILRTANGHDTKLASRDGLPPGGHEESAAEIEEVNGSIQRYGQGFLSAQTHDATLRVQRYANNGDVISAERFELPDFQPPISADNFSVGKGSANEVFAILNQAKKSLLLFDKDIKTSSTIDLSKNFFDSDQSSYRIFVSKELIFIIAADTQPAQVEDTEEVSLVREKEQKIIVVSIDEKKVIKEHQLDSEASIGRVAASDGGNLIFINEQAEENVPYIMNGANKPRQTAPLLNKISRVCWKDNGSFYYSGIDPNNSVYLYSVSKSASFLVYSNLNSSVVELNCDTGGKLYFSLEPNEAATDDPFQHMVISEKDQSGPRLESILPVYLSFPSSLAVARPFKDSINIKPLRGAPPKDQAQQKLYEELRSMGLPVEGVRINYLY